MKNVVIPSVKGPDMPAVVELSDALAVGAFSSDVQQVLVKSLLSEGEPTMPDKELLQAALRYLDSARQGAQYVTSGDFRALPDRPSERLQASSFCAQALEKLTGTHETSGKLYELMGSIQETLRAGLVGGLRDLASSDVEAMRTTLSFFRTLSGVAMSATAEADRTQGFSLSMRSGV